MSDDRDERTDALDEGALLAAYLDGETDDVTTTRLERRLAVDSDLAARLDAIAATRMRLQRLGDVPAPIGARIRVRQHIAAARAAAEPAAAADPRTAAQDRSDATDQLQAERRGWARRWTPALGVAAALLLVVVLGLSSIVGGGVEETAGGSDSAALSDVPADVGAAGGDAAPSADLGGAAEAGEGDARATAELGMPESAAEPDGGGSDTGGSTGTARAAVPVGGDAEIVARATRLDADPPASLRRRERRLRRQADLPTGRSCVDRLDARTVDLVEVDGRIALALLEDPGQVVLVEPLTCSAIRTISTQR